MEHIFSPYSTHLKLDQNPFHPKFKIYWDIHPNPYQSKNFFYLYCVKILAVLVSNTSNLTHISLPLLFSWNITLLLCCFYYVYEDLVSFVSF